MDIKIKNEFLKNWEKYFGKAELPFVYFYSSTPGTAALTDENKSWSCLICELARVRNGESLAYNESGLRCGGSKRYLGYAKGMRPNFEYFLSYGIPGEMEGERYIRTPEMVREIMKKMQTIPAEGKYIIFKRYNIIPLWNWVSRFVKITIICFTISCTIISIYVKKFI